MTPLHPSQQVTASSLPASQSSWWALDAWSRGSALLTLPAFRAWLRQQPDTSVLVAPLTIYLRCVTRAAWQQVGLQVHLVEAPSYILVLPVWALGIDQRCTLDETLITVADVLTMVDQVAQEEVYVSDAFAEEEVASHA